MIVLYIALYIALFDFVIALYIALRGTCREYTLVYGSTCWRWRHYRGGGGPLWLVREVAAIWGGPLWVVRGQIYGFTNTCVCINYNSSLTDLLRDHDIQLA